MPHHMTYDVIIIKTFSMCHPTNDGDWGDDETATMVITLFFSGIISLITVTGNVLVIVAFKVNRNLKSANNYFLLSLAVADIIIGLISMNLFTTYVTMGRWVLGPVCCDMWLVTDYVASNASVMHLLVISFDRYLSITRPLKYKAKRTTKRVVLMIVTAWTVSIILWAPAILFWQYIIEIEEDDVEKQFPELKVLYPAVFSFCGYESSCQTPRIDEISPGYESEAEGEDSGGKCGTPSRGTKNEFKEKDEAIEDRPARCQGPPARECTGRSTAVNARRQMTKRKHNNLVNEKKAAKTLSAILLAFIVTWTPYNIMVLVSTFCNKCIPSYLWNLGYWLCYVNSTVNPMCYALCNKTFRETFKLLLMCHQKEQNQIKSNVNVVRTINTNNGNKIKSDQKEDQKKDKMEIDFRIWVWSVGRSPWGLLADNLKGKFPVVICPVLTVYFLTYMLLCVPSSVLFQKSCYFVRFRRGGGVCS
uniref:Muscarinic acetylcholine receptor n=1 Tax=Eptatretus burgeri TaxID=7764 RepID=A0A8C4N8F8_EPTBU